MSGHTHAIPRERVQALKALLRRVLPAIGCHHTVGDRDRFREMQDLAIAEIDALFLERLQPRTLSQLAEFRRHDAELAKVGYSTSERMPIVCSRLGIQRSRYFELKKLVRSGLSTGLDEG